MSGGGASGDVALSIANGGVGSTQLASGLTLAGTTTGTFSGPLAGNASSATTTTNFTGSLAGNVTGTQGATVVQQVGGSTAAAINTATVAANNATTLATASAIVRRDGSGSFLANSIGLSNNLSLGGSLTFNAGASPIIYAGTGSTELGRYLQLITSFNSPSASGLKAGGLLVADSYSYADPGKNDLIVKGNVGIGTSTPTFKLQVAGSARISDALGIGMDPVFPYRLAIVGDIFAQGLGVGGNGIASSGGLSVSGNATFDNDAYFDGWIYNKWGTVYHRLDNGGTAGNPVIWQTSDARLKQDVETLHDALRILGRLRGVSFHWNGKGQEHLTRGIENQWRSASGTDEDNRKLWDEKRDEMLEKLSGAHTGFVAQEVEEVFPNWVRRDQEGYRQINLEQLTGVIVQGVNELAGENAALRKRLAELEGKDEERDARLTKLERFISGSHRTITKKSR